MPAYVIYDVDIRDLAQYQVYMAEVRPVVESFGGRYLVRGGPFKVVEGDWQPRRMVLFDFPSMAAWDAFYESPEYQALKPLRDASSTARLIVVDGGEGPPPV